MKPQLVARLLKVLKTEEIESVCAENQNECNIEATEAQIASNSSNEVLECASNDTSMDIDLADIVIIDEYDSTKNDSKHDTSSKRVNIIESYLNKSYKKIFILNKSIHFSEFLEKIR